MTVVINDTKRSVMDELAAIVRPPPKPVYPGYIALRIRDALKSIKVDAFDRVIEPDSVRMETVGDARHAVFCKDFNGAEYRIEIECVKDADGWVPARWRKTEGE